MRVWPVMGAALLIVLIAGCGDSSEPATEGCEYLFGVPGETSGLDESACRPERICRDIEDFTPPVYGEDVLGALTAATLVDPPSLLARSPYDDQSLVPADTSGVCAVQRAEAGYSLETYPDRPSAEAAGAVVTHESACGACSSLQDLAVYLSRPDLGTPVRECALIELGQNPEATRQCLLDLGFSEPCAQIWLFNSLNTREACLVECLEALDQPNHLADGSLNACLSCDEANSGPVFKAVAGRTRRNSGIPSAICRPGANIAAILHDSYPGPP